MAEKKEIEEGAEFRPKFNEDGLLPAIAQDAETNEILMVAYMNLRSLEMTLSCGLATYYSRSRKKVWQKGEQSGHTQKVEQVLVDCDQDCLLVKVKVDAGQCHVGYNSCFYREIQKDGSLKLVAEKVYDPGKTYKK